MVILSTIRAALKVWRYAPDFTHMTGKAAAQALGDLGKAPKGTQKRHFCIFL
jgi:hypothetical protein